MKFLYADSLDYVDPEYDFIQDRSRSGREPYWDDVFSHQYLGQAPYDGILVSRGIVGDHKFPGKYNQSQAMRFRREGARKFLRLDKPEFVHLDIFGDCGAFNYASLEIPPYTTSEILDFYEDAGFSHGCSVDHIIFEYERSLKGMEALPDTEASERVKARFEITLENAANFHKECSRLPYQFTPLGTVQGWSPGSMAEAARRLVAMGYDYLAIGGLVPLNAESIHRALAAIRELIPLYVRLHILGFGKIDQIGEFLDYGIASFDTTSPMIRAFKDNKSNFFMPSDNEKLKAYTAIRIPHSSESRTLSILVKKGHFTHEMLHRLESDALDSLRQFDRGTAKLGTALDAIMNYTRVTLINPKTGQPPTERKIVALQIEYQKILTDRPWQNCDCNVCKTVSVEGAIFRASNRNKRRGMHNLQVFNDHLKKMTGMERHHEKHTEIQSNTRAAK